ncbi:AMP-binding protein [Nocardioides zeae]|uniref:AMP-binding protein n=1 Tax=Nocardioides zeae TaxID=1457234 RepID=UPI0027D7A4D3|nr:AMP-binding protein [Nocardioides zeae]
MLAAAVAEHGPRVAVRDGSRSLTYDELHREVRELAGGLGTLVDGDGARVVTVLDNHVDQVCLWLAIAEAGLVSVPVNPESTSAQLARSVASVDASVVVVEGHRLDTVLAGLADLGPDARRLTLVVRGGRTDAQQVPEGVRVLPWAELLRRPGGAALGSDGPEPWDLQAVMFSSGSTGGPKRVLVTQAQTVTRAMVVDQRPATGDGVVLLTVPLFHVAGQCRGVLGPLMAGLQVVVAERFSVSGFWSTVRAHGVTSTLLMGSMMEYLLQVPPEPADADNPLQQLYAAPVSPRAAEFAARFGVTVHASYGSTEAGTVSTGPSTRPGSLGWLHRDFVAQVVDEVDVPVAPGAAGELVLRARHPWLMTPGYEGDPAATTALFRNQWLHTGDLVRQEEDGELVFVSRLKEVIRSNGENISPSEIEDFVRGLDDVVDCAAVGVANEGGEDDLKLVVVPGPGRTTVEDLCRQIGEGLPRHMFPRYVELRPDLPRTATAKTRKAELATRDGSGVVDVAHLRPARR